MRTATDTDGNYATAPVTIAINDLNDVPIFTQPSYGFTVAENAALNANVGTATVSDPDGEPLTLTLDDGTGSSGPFAIDSNGHITLAAGLDYETQSSYTFTATATDPTGDSATATVTINVTNVDEPPVFDEPSYIFAVNEDATPGTTTVGTVTATDPDAGDTPTYSITAGNSGGTFAIDPNTGDISLAAPLSYATQNDYTLTVAATVTPTDSAPAQVEIDVNAQAYENALSVSLDTTDTLPLIELSQSVTTTGSQVTGTSTFTQLEAIHVTVNLPSNVDPSTVVLGFETPDPELVLYRDSGGTQQLQSTDTIVLTSSTQTITVYAEDDPRAGKFQVGSFLKDLAHNAMKTSVNVLKLAYEYAADNTADLIAKVSKSTVTSVVVSQLDKPFGEIDEQLDKKMESYDVSTPSGRLALLNILNLRGRLDGWKDQLAETITDKIFATPRDFLKSWLPNNSEFAGPIDEIDKGVTLITKNISKNIVIQLNQVDLNLEPFKSAIADVEQAKGLQAVDSAIDSFKKLIEKPGRLVGSVTASLHFLLKNGKEMVLEFHANDLSDNAILSTLWHIPLGNNSAFSLGALFDPATGKWSTVLQGVIAF